MRRAVFALRRRRAERGAGHRGWDGALAAGTLEELSEWGQKLLLPRSAGVGAAGLLPGKADDFGELRDALSLLGREQTAPTKDAADAAAAALRYMDGAAAAGDAAAYRTALAVLRDSARELQTLAPALPSAPAAAASVLADRITKALPPKALDYAAGESDGLGDEHGLPLTRGDADDTIASPEHNDDTNSNSSGNAVEMFQRYDDTRKGFKFLSDERFNQLSIPAKKLGATVIRGEPEWERRLIDKDASAVTIGDIIAFRENVCISEVLEETRHFYQNQVGMNDDKGEPLRTVLNEIEAREYIFQNAERYQVPRNELDLLRKQYNNYLKQLHELEKK